MLLQMQIDVFNVRSLVQLVWLVAALITAITKIATVTIPDPVAEQPTTSPTGVRSGPYLQPAGLTLNQHLAHADHPAHRNG
jgi:hypothetical protein